MAAGKDGQQQQQFPCPMCKAYLKTEKALTSHIVNVHFETDTCPQCGHEVGMVQLLTILLLRFYKLEIKWIFPVMMS